MLVLIPFHFPGLQDASSVVLNDGYQRKLIMILPEWWPFCGLAVPYTGMILTAREPASIRTELMKYGISQIDGGTKIELGAYAENAVSKTWIRNSLKSMMTGA